MAGRREEGSDNLQPRKGTKKKRREHTTTTTTRVYSSRVVGGNSGPALRCSQFVWSGAGSEFVPVFFFKTHSVLGILDGEPSEKPRAGGLAAAGGRKALGLLLLCCPCCTAELTRMQHTNPRAWCCAGRSSSAKQGEIFPESALKALLRRNGKDFSVFSQAKCVPSCSELTSGFGGFESSLELG